RPPSFRLIWESADNGTLRPSNSGDCDNTQGLGHVPDSIREIDRVQSKPPEEDMMPHENGSRHHAISLLTGIVLLATVFTPYVSADVFVVFDEWGKGYACTIGSGAPGYPGCVASLNPSTPNFLRLASGLSTDPNTGFTNVLTYTLPGFNLTPVGPVILPNPGFGSDFGDALSFSGSQIFLYSNQDILGTGS